MKMAFFYIDLIATLSIPKATLATLEKRRSKAEEQAQKQALPDRQELLLKKKQEQKQKEQEKFDKLSPEAQKKWEEKEYKRQLKEKQARFKVKYG